MPSLVNRMLTLATLPTQVLGRLPDLVDAVIQLPDGLDRASRELRHTRQELEEAEYRIDRLVSLSQQAIDEMEVAVAQMQDGNARLEKLTPLAETGVNDMQTGITTMQEALAHLDQLSNAIDDIPMVDTEDD